MVSVTNVASLLIAAIAAGTQVVSAVPHPQNAEGESAVAESSAPAVAAETPATDQAAQENPVIGGTCDIATERILCADDRNLIFCDHDKWIAFATCTEGTVCKDGMCVHPDTEEEIDGAQSPIEGAETPENTKGSEVNQTADQQEGGDDADTASVANEGAEDSTDTNQEAVSSPVAESTPEAEAGTDAGGEAGTEAATEAETGGETQAESEAESEGTDGSGESGGGGGSSGDHFGIDCDKFKKAVTEAGNAIGQKYPSPSDAQCNSFLNGMPKGDISSAREAAMFLANIIWESDGLQAKEEYACQDMPDWCAQNYKTPEDVQGQTYWGRGYIQLTWHYNYIDASEGLFGDDRLTKDPSQVSKNEDIAWEVSFWFWKDRVRTDPGVQEGNFGASINKINGGLECRGGAQDKAKKRYEMYKVILPIFAPGETPKEAGCYN
ncbi:hypothetical protein GGI07_004615 [Coemansia sp. Benny D115]|nr:hypothetical protein GGI07_004615 [Coemansia sp. Benny D115]